MIVATTNSVYVIDTENKTWARTENNGDHGPNPLRTESGEYILIPFTPKVGERLVLICPAINPKALYREISTSEIVRITDAQ